MLPGKTFTPEDVIGILRRRYWWILVPFAVVGAGVALYAATLPDLYRSEALISLTPARVADGVLPEAASLPSLEGRLPAIRNQILIRPNLERIIQDLDLYGEERRTGIMEDIVERMRNNDISMTPVSGAAIRLGFQGRDARTVQRVADRLTTLFLEEGSRDRALQIDSTTQFLENSLRNAEMRLVERERNLAEYRSRHSGELPEQLDANLQALQTHQINIQTVTDGMDRARERRIVLSQTVEELENQADLTQAQPAEGSTASRLTAARAALVQAQLTFTADHPEVSRLRQVITNLETQLEEEAQTAPIGGSVSAAEQNRLRRLQEARAGIEEIDRQLARDEETLTELRKRVAEYLRRAEAAPARQTEMVGMNRDYSTLNQLYTSLLAQREQSNLAANLEQRQIGEQFRLLDGARVPSAPFSPQRGRLNLMGMAAGLGIGLLLVGLLEYRDSTFRTDDELVAVTGLPVLAVIPLMLSDPEKKKARTWRFLTGAVLGSLVVVCLAIVAYTFVS